MASAAKSERTGRVGGGVTWLLVGVLLGVLGAIFLPRFAGPYLPAGMRGEAVEVAGVVEAKSAAGERLLLTVASEAGATLVTFRENIAEIDLLVSVGDSVLLAVDEYAPFVDDADIRRVMKQRDWKPAAAAAAADTARARAGAADAGDGARGGAAGGAGAADGAAAGDSARLGVDTSRARLDTVPSARDDSARDDTAPASPADGVPPSDR